MSQFKPSQLYTLVNLFRRLAIDLTFEPTRHTMEQTLQEQHPHFPNIHLAKQFGWRLGLPELNDLLIHLGMSLTVKEVRRIMYQYDTSCTGFLDLHDFLEFMADFQVTLKAGELNLREEYRQLNQSSKRPLAMTEDEYVKAKQGALQQASVWRLDSIKDAQSQIVNPAKPLPPKLDDSYLVKNLTVRISEARHLDTFRRMKVWRNDGIMYESLNPFVTVTLCGQSKSTNVLLNEVYPEWYQDLDFTIRIPALQCVDIQTWVQQQVIDISLYDYCNNGYSTTSEWLGGASIPLAKLFNSPLTPRRFTVQLTHVPGLFDDNPTIENPINAQTASTNVLIAADGDFTPAEYGKSVEIDVSFVEQVDEKMSWFAVADHFVAQEDIWIQRYGSKFRRELSTPGVLGTHSDQDLDGGDLKRMAESPRRAAQLNGDLNIEAREPSVSLGYSTPGQSIYEDVSAGNSNEPDTFFNYYIGLRQAVKQLFPRRPLSAVGLDEYNTFRVWPSFLRPCAVPHAWLQLWRIYSERIPSKEDAPTDPQMEVLERLVAMVAKLPFHRSEAMATQSRRRDQYVPFQAPPSQTDHAEMKLHSQAAASNGNNGNHPQHGLATALEQLDTSTDWFNSASHRTSTVITSTGSSNAEVLFTAANDYASSVTPVAVQTCSPSTMMMHGRGTVMEHCIWLCNLFLGLGVQAYVAMGQAHGVTQVWVVTLHPTSTELPPPLPVDATLLENKFVHIHGKDAGLHPTVLARHWDVVTARSYRTYPTEVGCPFESIHTLFNDKQIYWNTQNSDEMLRVDFSWTLCDTKSWCPVLTPEVTQLFGSPVCWYSAPNLLIEPMLQAPMDESILLPKLMDGMRLFRRHLHFMATTRFHRSISRLLQKHIGRFEQLFGSRYLTSRDAPLALNGDALNPDCGSSDNGSRAFGAHTNVSQLLGRDNFSKSSTNVDLEDDTDSLLEEMSHLERTQVERSRRAMNSATNVRALEAALNNLIGQRVLKGPQARLSWHGRVCHFDTTSIRSILAQLAYLGCLGEGMPLNTFGVAMSVHYYAYNVTSVWVFIGHLSDVDSLLNIEARTSRLFPIRNVNTLANAEKNRIAMQCLQVDADGTLTLLDSSKLLKTDFCAAHGLQMRDFRQLEWQKPSVSPYSLAEAASTVKNGAVSDFSSFSAILSRPPSLVVHLTFIRAVIKHDRVFLLTWPEQIQHPAWTRFLHDLQEQLRWRAAVERLRLAEKGKDSVQIATEEMPFEFQVLEIILEHTSTFLQNHLEELQPLVDALLSEIERQVGRETLQRLLWINRRLTRCEAQVIHVRDAVNDVLKSDLDMSEMYLTDAEQRRKQLLEANDRVPTEFSPSEANITWESLKRPVSEHEELELLLEHHLKRFDELAGRLNELATNVQSSEDISNIVLDAQRNHFLELELKLTMAGLSVSTGGLIAALFGMNLLSGWEESPFAFLAVTGVCLASGVFVYAFCSRALVLSVLGERNVRLLRDVLSDSLSKNENPAVRGHLLHSWAASSQARQQAFWKRWTQQDKNPPPPAL